jgi:hypothetical protein
MFVESCFATSRLDRHHDKRYDSQQWDKEEIALLVLDPPQIIFLSSPGLPGRENLEISMCNITRYLPYEKKYARQS